MVHHFGDGPGVRRVPAAVGAREDVAAVRVVPVDRQPALVESPDAALGQLFAVAQLETRVVDGHVRLLHRLAHRVAQTDFVPRELRKRVRPVEEADRRQVAGHVEEGRLAVRVQLALDLGSEAGLELLESRVALSAHFGLDFEVEGVDGGLDEVGLLGDGGPLDVSRLERLRASSAEHVRVAPVLLELRVPVRPLRGW